MTNTKMANANKVEELTNSSTLLALVILVLVILVLQYRYNGIPMGIPLYTTPMTNTNKPIAYWCWSLVLYTMVFP